MDLFYIIDDGVAILRMRGRVYKQTKLYRRGEHLYVPASGGYIQLTRGSGTSDPNISCIGVEGPGVVFENNLPKYREPKPKKGAKLAAVG